MEPSPKPGTRKIISSVQRALDILDLFSNGRAELGNSEIAKLMGLPIGTVSGLIYTLKVNNYLDQNPVNRKYRLGIKIAERASVLLEQMDLRKIAAPYLIELRDWCGESVNLAIRDQFEVVYIERMFGGHSLGIRSELGRRGCLHSTSLGKAILANLPVNEKDLLLNQYTFELVTPYTITDRAKFEADLELTRQRGFALDDQENEIGGRCVGAPVLDLAGYPIAAISISVPLQRFPTTEIERFGEKVRQTAVTISRFIA